MPQSSDRAAMERERRRQYAGTHSWIGAAELPLSAAQARTADLRAAVTIKADTRVQIIDAYCKGCRRTFEDCSTEPCPARDQRTSEHLRGGRPGERIRNGRAHPPMPVLPPNQPAPVPAPTRRPPPLRPVPALPAPVPQPIAVARPARPAGRRRVIPVGQLSLEFEAIAS